MSLGREMTKEEIIDVLVGYDTYDQYFSDPVAFVREGFHYPGIVHSIRTLWSLRIETAFSRIFRSSACGLWCRACEKT